MQALDARRSQEQATGTVRTAAPATHFTLVDHPVHDGGDAVRDQLVILRAQHSARNNLWADHKVQVISLLGQLAQDKKFAKGDWAAEFAALEKLFSAPPAVDLDDKSDAPAPVPAEAT